jgi:hypothetical protein
MVSPFSWLPSGKSGVFPDEVTENDVPSGKSWIFPDEVDDGWIKKASG